MSASASRDVASVLSTVIDYQLTRVSPTGFNGVVATQIPPPTTLKTIAGSAALDEVLACLRARRPVSFFELATDQVTVHEAQRARPPSC